jgi:AAA domain
MPDPSANGPQRSVTASPLAGLRSALGAGARPPGSLGVIAARPGVGKTAVLVQIALDAMVDGQKVLHVSLHDTVDHTRVHYDEVLRALGEGPRSRSFASPEALVRLERSRTIQSCHHRPFDVPAIERNLDVLADAAHFTPQLVMVDGFASAAALAEHLPALRALAVARQVELWVAVASEDPQPLQPTDLLVRLTAAGRGLRLVFDGAAGEVAVNVDPVTGLAIAEDGAAARASDAGGRAPVVARDCTLFSGGAAGAEAAFGEAAERHGVHETNLTFDGHLQARTQGRYELTATELSMGDVSLSYVSRRLNRTYNDQGGLIRGVLQTLWHMVSRSQQVFVIGRIQEDGTVVGGTGWSVELARMWSRDLWVFDQEKLGWYRWEDGSWVLGTPRITTTHICGTGTRYLEESGRRAIEELFARTFPAGS